MVQIKSPTKYIYTKFISNSCLNKLMKEEVRVDGLMYKAKGLAFHVLSVLRCLKHIGYVQDG